MNKREAIYENLQREKTPDKIKRKNWIDKWMSNYPDCPENNKKLLLGHLKSEEDEKFLSAYFELQVYCILSLLGCKIEVHPHFPSKKGTVDFGVKSGEDKFYLEATVCGYGRGNLSSNEFKSDAVEKIEKAFPILEYNILIDTEGVLSSLSLKTQMEHTNPLIFGENCYKLVAIRFCILQGNSYISRKFLQLCSQKLSIQNNRMYSAHR